MNENQTGQAASWVSRFDALTITVDPESARVRLRLRPGRVFVAVGAVVALVVALVAIAAVSAVKWPWVVPFLAIFIVNRTTRRPTRGVLHEPMLAAAAVDIARTLGRPRGTSSWRLAGPEAGVLGTELQRLDAIAATWRGRTPAERERLLFDLAGPQLRRFLRPTPGRTAEPDALEPPVVEPGFHRPGDPWPTLSTPPPQWPQWEDRS